MLAPFLIMLREGIEAALLTSIIAGYLKQTGRGAWLPAVWVGVLLAVALSLFAGTLLQMMAAEFPQKAQELFEAIVGLVAVTVLVSMVFWMRKAARSIQTDLRGAIDAALKEPAGEPGTTAPVSAAWPLIGMTFFAVGREGLESVFFLLAIFQQSPGPLAPIGALLGLVVAVGLGVALYRGGIRLDLRRFFRWTGVFILIVAAGLASASLRSLHEAGLWNHLQARAYDLSDTLPVSSVLGTVLSGVFNYQDAPAIGEAIVYGLFLLTTLIVFLKPPRPAPLRRAAPDSLKG
ncbi:iron uptake transporter permease EfeU [Rhodospirillum rubrum]|uniref:Iron permease FTR1 n=1 Tax=Rhodospirillum rubrum (strain ATCC 11170 / ATH 1.1.1 / DSM 467 / LMG 4362 / NCIMB 8255 / S1) TaxID=269796 RepID=Q2RR51_RHORT|nr:iron uptake transporter permease EfeU [Rhodospirillum rubrum]ABC23394.1 Iron permease FTR1 [Rhodospirillum rubrum ATCC 11170]MBK5955044.1 iron transporter [Rhodospirillum rubrum]QXG79367.1 FTR1 family protein [Rhodospirillum rubrum]